MRFYRLDEIGPPRAAAVAPDVWIRTWRPAVEGFPPRRSRRFDNLVWWAFDALGVFASDGFAEITLWRGGRRLHRLIVTPPWPRFPFMARRDLQIGDLWTVPSARGQGLARAAVAEAQKHAADWGAERLWYVVDAENAPSVALVESFGYRLVGEGDRSRPMGLGLFGRYRIAGEAARA